MGLGPPALSAAHHAASSHPAHPHQPTPALPRRGCIALTGDGVEEGIAWLVAQLNKRFDGEEAGGKGAAPKKAGGAAAAAAGSGGGRG